MKRTFALLIGSLLFIAGYYQARKQTEYMQAIAIQASPAYAEKPIIFPAQNTPTFAFYLSRSLAKN